MGSGWILLLQATWVTLLWYASVPRPDMLAQLHASGLLQSLLLKNMQAAYARMQGAAVQVPISLPFLTPATQVMRLCAC